MMGMPPCVPAGVDTLILYVSFIMGKLCWTMRRGRGLQDWGSLCGLLNFPPVVFFPPPWRLNGVPRL